MKWIIPAFWKKKEEERKMASVCIVFNITNHASLMAAMLLSCALRERTTLEVMVVDVRDTFPQSADMYLWLDVGVYDDFRNYMEAIALASASMRQWVVSLRERSVFMVSSKTQDRQVPDTVIGMAFDFFEEHSQGDLDTRLTFGRYAVVSELWHTNDIDAETAASYAKALQYAYYHYLGKDLSLEMLMFLLVAKEDTVKDYLANHKCFNRAMAHRCQVRSVAGHSVQYINACGPEVYGILRRIALTKQDFMHVSEGSYGRIVYSSISIPDNTIESKQVLNLSAMNGIHKS